MSYIQNINEILTASKKVATDPIIGIGLKHIFDWLKNIFSNKKLALQRVELLEKLEASNEEIQKLETSLEEELFEKKEMEESLKEKISELQLILKTAGVDLKSNVSINNSTDIINLSGVNVGRDIKIVKK